MMRLAEKGGFSRIDGSSWRWNASAVMVGSALETAGIHRDRYTSAR